MEDNLHPYLSRISGGRWISDVSIGAIVLHISSAENGILRPQQQLFVWNSEKCITDNLNIHKNYSFL